VVALAAKDMVEIAVTLVIPERSAFVVKVIVDAPMAFRGAVATPEVVKVNREAPTAAATPSAEPDVEKVISESPTAFKPWAALPDTETTKLDSLILDIPPATCGRNQVEGAR
jgi:hypothetical protein